jgi:hypothetical protein
VATSVAPLHDGSSFSTKERLTGYTKDLRKELIESGKWDLFKQHFMNKVATANHTAPELTKASLSFVAAKNLHK